MATRSYLKDGNIAIGTSAYKDIPIKVIKSINEKNDDGYPLSGVLIWHGS